MVPEEAWEDVILGYILLPRDLSEVGAFLRELDRG